MCSPTPTPMLLQYIVFSPASVVIDIIRLAATSHDMRGRGWLIFFVTLEMICKVRRSPSLTYEWRKHHQPLSLKQTCTWHSPRLWELCWPGPSTRHWVQVCTAASTTECHTCTCTCTHLLVLVSGEGYQPMAPQHTVGSAAQQQQHQVRTLMNE